MTNNSLTPFTRDLLSPEVIARFFHEWRQVQQHIRVINAGLPAGARLGNPKLQGPVTESLAVTLLNRGHFADQHPMLAHAELALGRGDKPDAWVWTTDGRRLRMEIKGTGRMTWSRVSKNDSKSDIFCWINAGPIMSNAEAMVHVWLVPNFGHYFCPGQDWRSEAEFQRIVGAAYLPMRMRLPR